MHATDTLPRAVGVRAADASQDTIRLAELEQQLGHASIVASHAAEADGEEVQAALCKLLKELLSQV